MCVPACVCECESVCVRVCLVRVLCKPIRASVRASASARAGAYTRACVRACARRYLLLRLQLEPARLWRDGRGRAVGRRWLRRVRPTLIGTGGALHSHTKPSVQETALVCVSVDVGVELLVSVCWCSRIRAHVCVRARTRVRACVRVRV